jgi:hypothetical protein
MPKNKKIRLTVTRPQKPDRKALDDNLKQYSKSYNFSGKLEELLPIDISEAQELVIGLDFGTAFTKIVIGSEVDAEALSFGKYGYLLPSQFYSDNGGNCSLYENGSNCFKDLKLPVLTRSASPFDQVAIVCFLALVFKECRVWQKKSIYRSKDIDWLINSGLPTESYDEKVVVSLYRKVINAAWICSFQKKINIRGCNQAIKNIETKDFNYIGDYRLHSDCLNLFPEFAAQIVGYVQSPSRRAFSHLLVDIGAGTIDVAMFIVSSTGGEWLFEITGKDIQTLGGDILAKHRMHHSKTVIDIREGFPTDVNFAQLLGVPLNTLKLIDKPFISAVNSSLNKVVNSVALGHRFGEDITTFICGGGSKIKLYTDQVEALKTKFPLQIIPLIKPDRLRNLDIHRDSYHRLSVAYGLSYDPLNIGKVTRKSVSLKQVINKRSPNKQAEIDRNREEMYK